ncbi:MAG TPA: hypothetical protein VN131_01090 [Mobilitalea sp.]|nr:hypothetical protein [Mobilitalea sp.]
MVCRTCGRVTQNEEANFCEYCGSSYREQAQFAMNIEPQNNMTVEQEALEKPIPFINWLATYGIILIPTLFIPFIGWIVPIVMLFVWAFNNKTVKSKKNWARATLIFLVVYIILAIAIFVSFMNTPMFQNILNGKFDINSLLNNSNLQ